MQTGFKIFENFNILYSCGKTGQIDFAEKRAPPKANFTEFPSHEGNARKFTVCFPFVLLLLIKEKKFIVKWVILVPSWVPARLSGYLISFFCRFSLVESCLEQIRILMFHSDSKLMFEYAVQTERLSIQPSNVLWVFVVRWQNG